MQSLLRKITSIPTRTLLRKIVNKSHRVMSDLKNRKRDLGSSTFTSIVVPDITKSYINILSFDVSKIEMKVAHYLTKMYLDHRFDLLGSGWVKNSYDSPVPGLENYSYNNNLVIPQFDGEGEWLKEVVHEKHLELCREMWQKIDLHKSNEYTPIDWQKDFKSGCRWSAKEWYRDQKIGHLPGADIKVPWELARMQHLPPMAIFAKVIEDKENLKNVLNEFRAQILDFISTNPPRMGANWMCTMDVGIRAVNMLLAYDMFSKIDSFGILDKDFRHSFAQSIYEHGTHIVNNLEYSKDLTTNHYLSNVAGLLFIAAYLERSEESDVWLAFSVQEIINEMKKQFYEDGGNFESSTSYHRLSTEIITYSAALILGLDDDKKKALDEYNRHLWEKSPPLRNHETQEYDIESLEFFPLWFIKRLSRAGILTCIITKPNGEIPQIGDNDSGRFVRLTPMGSFSSHEQACARYLNLQGYKKLYEPIEEYWDENILNHKTLISALSGLFDCADFTSFGEEIPLESSLIMSLAKGKKLQVNDIITAHCKTPSESPCDSNALSYRKQNFLTPEIEDTRSLKQNMTISVFPDSGIYVIKSDRIHLTISAVPNGQRGNGGHAHNDRLSFELNIDGKDIVVDPGTYLYTPMPERRNQFRSVKAHNTLVVEGKEQNDWLDGKFGLFYVNEEAVCSLVHLSQNIVGIMLSYKDIVQLRQITMEDKKIIIDDFSNVEFEMNINNHKLYSNGYGKVVAL